MRLTLFFTLCEAQITQGTFDSIDVAKVTDHAYSLLIAGSASWLLGSIHNAFQVYENTDTRVQFMQKTVSVPLLIANVLFLVATILSFETWNLPPVAIKAAVASCTFTPCLIVIIKFSVKVLTSFWSYKVLECITSILRTEYITSGSGNSFSF